MKLTNIFSRALAGFGLLMLVNVGGIGDEVAFDKPFYNVNLNGDMTTLGNTIIWKDTTAAANAYGVDVSTSLPTDRNNAYTMKFVDVLSDGSTTFNSSSSSLALTAGYTVKWAGLYWQGHIANKNLDSGADNSKIGTGTGRGSSLNTSVYNNAKSLANTVYFRLPSGTNYNLTAQVFYDYPTDVSGGTDRRYLYSGFYNVTDYVKAGGNGSYTVGNIRTSEGQIDAWGGLGGWAMVVIYEDPTGALQLKNVSVFNGYRVLNSGQTQDITVNGFLTPSAGTLKASLAVFVADGDKEGSLSTGEHLKIWNTASVLTDITNTTNPLNNVFNSSITNMGVDNVVRTPSFTDNLGIDIDRFDVSSYMKYGQTSTKIQLSTVGDLYTIDMIAFATDLYTPEVCYTETITNNGISINGTKVKIGDLLDVNVTVLNRGVETAKGVTIEKVFEDPTILEYNPSTLSIKNIGAKSLASKTDGSLDDSAEFDSNTFTAKYFLGNGADATNGKGGGTIANDQNTSFHYQMAVKKYAPSTVNNSYLASYSSSSFLVPIQGVPIPKCTTFNNNITIFNPGLFEECGFFPDALSTRQACTPTSVGSITFDGSANIINNPDHSLSTCKVTTPQWVLDQTQTCTDADCVALPGNSQAMTLNYNNPPSLVSNTTTPASTSATNVTVSSNSSASGAAYNAIAYNWSGYTLTSSQTSDLSVNTIAMTKNDAFNIASNGLVQIGQLTSTTNPGNKAITTGNPTNIQIDQVSMGNGSTVNLSAANTLYINNFTVGRGSIVTLKAKKVRLNTLTASNAGSGNTNITIYADEVDIGTLDMGQNATVKIYPYTTGGNVFLKSNTIQASSSSTLLLSSGDYYTNSLNLPGTSDSSSIAAMDANQLINFYINGNFTPGNNPGINSAGNNGNFGTLPSTTFRIMINGNLNTGGGGTTINALVYVEGSVNLGNPTYVRGAISAGTTINIGQGSKIYYDGNISNEVYAACANSTYTINAYLDAWDDNKNINDKKITTKIVNKPFNLTLASLDSTATSYQAFPTTDLKYRIVPVSQCPDLNTTGYTQWKSIDLTSTPHQTIPFTLTQASKQAKVQFEINNSGTYERNCSSDAFAIRPDRFILKAPTEQDIELLSSGKVYNFSLTAAQYGNSTPSSDYNVTGITNTSGLLYPLQTIYNPSGNVDSSLNGTLALSTTSFNIVNGLATNVVDMTFDDVGKVNIQLIDKTWAAVDNGDTDQNCSGAYICGDINATFIPDHFTLSGVHVKNNNGEAFTYISNDLNVSSQMDVNVTAKNFSDIKTQNFNAASWENPVNIGMTIATTGTPTAIKHDINSTINLGFDSGALTIPYTETNTTKQLRFNFTRTVNTAINPFVVNGSDVSLTATSKYTSSSGATATPTGSLKADQNAIFVYGRTHAPRYRFTSATGVAKIFYEMYCGADGNKSILQQFNSPLKGDSDSAGWYLNENHNVASDGVYGTVSEKNINNVSVTLPTNSTGFSTVTLTYPKNGTGTFPYKTTMQNTASSWLIYDPYNTTPIPTANEFEVEFYKTGIWTGKITNTTTVDDIAAPVTSKRILW